MLPLGVDSQKSQYFCYVFVSPPPSMHSQPCRQEVSVGKAADFESGRSLRRLAF